MLIMILGILVWYLGHSFHYTAPNWRQGLFDKYGDKARGILALIIITGVILMIVGYNLAPYNPVFTPPAAAKGIALLCGFIGFLLTGVGNSKSRLRGKMRHPMLTGFAIWSIGHIVVSGTSKGLILWGAMLVWALLWMQLINRREGPWKPTPVETSLKGDIRLVVITLVLVVVILGIHHWLLG